MHVSVCVHVFCCCFAEHYKCIIIHFYIKVICQRHPIFISLLSGSLSIRIYEFMLSDGDAFVGIKFACAFHIPERNGKMLELFFVDFDVVVAAFFFRVEKMPIPNHIILRELHINLITIGYIFLLLFSFLFLFATALFLALSFSFYFSRACTRD